MSTTTPISIPRMRLKDLQRTTIVPKRKSQRLTQEFVDGLVANPDKEGWYSDERFEGFGIRTRPNGAITYELRWREGTSQKRHKICRTSEQPLAEVLEHVRTELIPSKMRGGDTASSTRRVENAAEATVYDVYMDLMDELDAKGRSNGYINETARLWFQYLRTTLGDLLVQAVTRKEIEEYLESLSDYPSEANQVRALITRLFKLAARLDYRDDNPAIDLAKFAPAPRTEFLSDDHKHQIDHQGRDLISSEAYDRIVVLMETGFRPVELTRFTWEGLDLNQGIWNKTTKRDAQPTNANPGRTFQLSPRVVEILSQRKAQGHAVPFAPFSIRRAWARLQLEFEISPTLKPYMVSPESEALSV